MKQNSNLRKWLPAVITGLALAGSTSLCLAQGTITQNFNSGASSISDFSVDYGGGTVEWGATNGVGGSGCLKVTLSAADTNTTQIAAKWVFPGGPLSASTYLNVEYDVMIDDTVSGVDAAGVYGNYQDVLSDVTNSWNSANWTPNVGPAGTLSTWKHMANGFPNNGQLFPKIDFLLQGTAPYTTNVVFYIDNLVVNPVPNPYVWYTFTNDTSSGWVEESWTGVAGTASWNTTQDAGGGYTPIGCLQLDSQFTTNGWQQSWFQHPVPWSPSRWVYFECDVKVDGSVSTPKADGTYGSLGIDIRNSSWGDNFLVGAPVLSASFTQSWQHVKLPLPTPPLVSSAAMDITITRGSAEAVAPFVRLLVDNIKITSPITPPPIYALQPGTPGGVKIFVDSNGTNNLYDHEGVSAPAADSSSKNFFWLYQTPASYSFTISHFPSPATAPSFEAHMYIVNGDSLTAVGQDFNWNSTYSGVPWNAADYMGFTFANGTNGGVVAALEWKTNSPASGATNRTEFTPAYTSLNGTWTVNFPDYTHASIVGPDGAVVGTVDLPDFNADPNSTFNFAPATSIFQFGVSKGGNAANDNQSAYFTHVVVTNVNGVIYDDAFEGPGLTGKYAWRVAQDWQFYANRVSWSPAGTAYWLKYGEPSFGFTVQSTADLTPPASWGDAGVTYSYTDATGTNHFSAIPAASLPAGSSRSVYFRLIK